MYESTTVVIVGVVVKTVGSMNVSVDVIVAVTLEDENIWSARLGPA